MASTNLMNLLRVAAQMKAAGMSWKAVGAKVHRSHKTVCHWPRLFKKHWAPLYNQAVADLHEETGAEGLVVIRSNLRSKRESTQLKAAALLLKHFPHQRRTLNPLDPEGERDWEVERPDRARLYRKVKEEMSAEREKEGKPPPTREEILREVREWVNDDRLEAEERDGRPRRMSDLTAAMGKSPILSKLGSVLGGAFGAMLVLGAFLTGQRSPLGESAADRATDCRPNAGRVVVVSHTGDVNSGAMPAALGGRVGHDMSSACPRKAVGMAPATAPMTNITFMTAGSRVPPAFDRAGYAERNPDCLHEHPASAGPSADVPAVLELASPGGELSGRPATDSTGGLDLGTFRAITGRGVAMLAIASALIGQAGCGKAARNSVPPRVAATGGWVDVNAPPPQAHVARKVSDCPRNVLALSSGGMFGAYSAGVLCGWGEVGDRPEFDVVTGVSTGALASTYAFLGTRYDPELKRLFTTVTDRDIYRRKGPLAPLRSDSLASSAPLRRLIENQLTPQVISEVAEAHAKGRRLYVGTTNLDTKRLVVWDMGAIAARGDTNLYTDVLLASSSIPGLFPPVEIEVEVNGRRHVEPHADGGIAAPAFVQRAMLTGDSAEGGTVWVVIAGKLFSEPSSTGTRTIDVGVSAVNTLLYAQTRGEVRRIATIAQETGTRFRLTAVPDDFPVDSSDQMFDPEVMGKLFDIGYTMGRSGPKGWRDAPPEEVQEAPRTGTQFLAPEPQGKPTP